MKKSKFSTGFNGRFTFIPTRFHWEFGCFAVVRCSLDKYRIFYLGKKNVATKRWKLIHDELYYLIDDPRETNNVARRHPEIVRRLSAELERYQALSGPACMPKGKTRQRKPYKDWVMPDIEVDDPETP